MRGGPRTDGARPAGEPVRRPGVRVRGGQAGAPRAAQPRAGCRVTARRPRVYLASALERAEHTRAVRDALKTASPAKDKATDDAPATTKATVPLVPERTWTNAGGKPLAAALITVTDGQGMFRPQDGTTFSYAIDQLPSADQELIGKAQQP